ncbi:MAG: ASKHA domain-containing protein [Candidatus Brocadiia bacterium]
MTRETVRVTFQPEGRNVFVLTGTTVVEAAGQAGIILNTPCGGEGTCGKCRVRVKGEAPEPTPADRRHLEEEELAEGMRLGCQMRIERDTVITVPDETRFFEQVVLTEGKEHQFDINPNVRKFYLDVGEPRSDAPRSDVDRLQDAFPEEMGEISLDLEMIRRLPGLMRDGDFKVTAAVEGNDVVSLEPGNTTSRVFGVSFDIGTTTIVGSLLDLSSGNRLEVASRTNPQVHFGDDVVGRVQYAEEHENGLDQLHRRLIGCMNEIILELSDGAGVELGEIYEITAVGNPTMTHTLLAVTPEPIAYAPYVPVVRDAVDCRAGDVGIDVHPGANLHVLPNISGYVGSDTVAVAVAARMKHSSDIRLAIDIGTNGEIIMGNRDRLVSASCAAGPAFEGARIKYGMRGSEGAIDKVVINEGIEVGVVGGGRARGICGSGLLDAVAELLDAGVIDSGGRVRGGDDLPGGAPGGLSDALVTVDEEPAVVLVPAHESKTEGPIVLTQKDVRELQLAKAAIWAGIQVVCAEFDLEPAEVPEILVAGGFGNFIRRSSAQRVGLLPDMPGNRIEFIGNAASVGARVALMCRSCREEAREISREADYIELAHRPDFQMHYADAMMFPEDDG